MSPMHALPLGLLSEPRRRIVGLLRARDHTIQELAAALTVTTNSVRAHLAALGREGLVAPGPARRRDTPGKPATVYGLTAAAEELFPRGYAPLLFGVLDLLADWDGADAPAELMRAAGARVAAGTGATGAARALAELGAQVSVATKGDGSVLAVSGCPFAARVLERPELCGWVAALLEGASGARATAVCDHAGGSPRCRFELGSSARAS